MTAAFISKGMISAEQLHYAQLPPVRRQMSLQMAPYNSLAHYDTWVPNDDAASSFYPVAHTHVENAGMGTNNAFLGSSDGAHTGWSTARGMYLPRGQKLDMDFLPMAYDASWATEPESYDAPEFQEAFNGADAEGASWRKYVPMAVFSDTDWFDDAGNYLGMTPGATGKTTVTRR
jgi:hypothetical protein